MVTDQRFTRQKYASSGLMYYGARYYDPAIGAFISLDTLMPDAGSLFSYNRYMYVSGNPLNRTDGSGHCEGPADGKVDYDSCLGINGIGEGEGGSSGTNSVPATSTGGLFSSIGTSIRNGWNWITGSGSDSTEGIVSAGDEAETAAQSSSPEGIVESPSEQTNPGKNVSSIWRGQNTTIVGQMSSGRLAGYSEGISDLRGGLSSAEQLFQTMTGRALQPGDSSSLAPTDIFIEPGELEVRFRPTSSSGTPVMEIVNHATETFEKIHFNQ